MYLYADGMEPYKVTEADLIWFLRAVEAEGAIESEVAATLLNGFCFTRSEGQKRTLTSFIRSYAQPVNPNWYITGEKFLNDLKRLPPEAQTRAETVALNRERVASTRTDFTLVAQRAVVAALSGLVKIPPNATDYAAPFIDSSYKYKALVVATPGRNRLWARKNTEKWKGFFVEPLEVQPWLAAASTVRLERAFDREFNTELSKIAQFFADNAGGYTNRKKQMGLGEIRINVGEVGTYSSGYIPALRERETNEYLSSFARAEQMQRFTRAAHYEAASKNNLTSLEQWARQRANHTRAVNNSEKPLVVANALGFDFTTGTWSVTRNGTS